MYTNNLDTLQNKTVIRGYQINQNASMNPKTYLYLIQSLFSPSVRVPSPMQLRTVTCLPSTDDTSKISLVFLVPAKNGRKTIELANTDTLKQNEKTRQLKHRQKHSNERIFTCVPLPEPGGPSSMALMPGNLTSSWGCNLWTAAKGGMATHAGC